MSSQDTARVTSRRSSNVLIGVLRACRPKQWVKNVLVVAAPAAAGQLTDPAVAARTALAFLVFTLAASGTYLVNDVQDRHEDAAHVTKRHRPIAAGIVPVPLAATLGVLLLAAAPTLALVAGLPTLALVVGIYVVLQFGYSGGLKKVPLLDLAIVASGFVLRAVAGGVAADVRLSQWFIIVTSFAALYLVASKRYAELRDASAHVVTTRASLAHYTVEGLREIRLTSIAVTLAAYVLWAFENAASGGAIWFELSILPFALALFRYGMSVDAGLGEAPEEIVLRDRTLVAYGAVWAVVFGVGVYA